MNVLVTGASGFIGRACVAALGARGVAVLSPASRELDLLDDAAVRGFLADARPSHLLHAAWRPVSGDVMGSADNLAWTRASLALLEGFQAAGGQRAALLGSCAEYDWSFGLCRTGITPLRPASPYGVAKHELRLAAEALAERTGLSVVWPRVFFVYGAGEHPSRLSVHVLRRLLAGQPVELTHGRQVRDYLPVGDVAAGVVAALLSDIEGEIDIASGAPCTVRELACEIARQLGREDLLRFGARPAPPDEAPVVLSDIADARARLAWRPATDLPAGVAALVAWGRETFPTVTAENAP